MGVDSSAIWWPPELVEDLVDEGFRVVRFDNRDTGLSTYLDDSGPPYGVEEMADDTVGLLRALDLESAHFVGMSLGGMIGQELALRHRDRVRSLTLVSTTPGSDERLSPPTDSLLAFFREPADEDPVQYAIDFARALAGRRFPFEDNEQDWRELVVADLARGTNPSSRQGLIPASTPSRIDELMGVQVPTLVVHGTEDPLFPFDHAEALAKAIQGATWCPGKASATSCRSSSSRSSRGCSSNTSAKTTELR